MKRIVLVVMSVAVFGACGIADEDLDSSEVPDLGATQQAIPIGGGGNWGKCGQVRTIYNSSPNGPVCGSKDGLRDDARRFCNRNDNYVNHHILDFDGNCASGKAKSVDFVCCTR